MNDLSKSPVGCKYCVVKVLENGDVEFISCPGCYGLAKQLGRKITQEDLEIQGHVEPLTREILKSKQPWLF